MARIFIFLIVISFPLLSKAGCTSTGCTSTIKRIYLTGRSPAQVLIQPSENLNGRVDCTPVETKYLTLHASHPLFKEIYSTLLASHIANEEVWLRVASGSNDCRIVYLVKDK